MRVRGPLWQTEGDGECMKGTENVAMHNAYVFNTNAMAARKLIGFLEAAPPALSSGGRR